MSYDGTIQRNGKAVTWIPMSGTDRVYDVSSQTMVGAPENTGTVIYAVIDGYMSQAGKVRGEQFDPHTLTAGGILNIFTTEAVHVGDRIIIDGSGYTVIWIKTIWKKDVIVLREAQVSQ